MTSAKSISVVNAFWRLGPASGFLTSEMEKRGAEVVSVEVTTEPAGVLFLILGRSCKNYSGLAES